MQNIVLQKIYKNNFTKLFYSRINMALNNKYTSKARSYQQHPPANPALHNRKAIVVVTLTRHYHTY